MLAHPRASQGGCHVGILGFGTVGSAVARRLTGHDAVRGLRLTHICDRRAIEKRGSLPDDLVATDFIDLGEAAEFAPEVMDGECSV